MACIGSNNSPESACALAPGAAAESRNAMARSAPTAAWRAGPMLAAVLYALLVYLQSCGFGMGREVAMVGYIYTRSSLAGREELNSSNSGISKMERPVMISSNKPAAVAEDEHVPTLRRFYTFIEILNLIGL